MVRDGAAAFPERLGDLRREFEGIGIGCDVIACSESEVRSLARRGGAFARAVLDEGRALAGQGVPP